MAKTNAGKYLETHGNVADKIRAGDVPGHTASGFTEHRADEPQVLWIDIDLIGDSPYQHAEFIDGDEYQALVESMRKSPYPFALNVNIDEEKPGYYFLTAGGHQRRNAAKAAGRTKMAVFVEPQLTPLELAFRAARENFVQVNRNRVNMGFLFRQMLKDFKSMGLTQEKIAEELGDDKGRSYVEYCILAADDDYPDIQELIIERPDSIKVMLYLRRIKPLIKEHGRTVPNQGEIAEAEARRRQIADKYKTGEYSAKGVELEVRKVLQQQNAGLQSEETAMLKHTTTEAHLPTVSRDDANEESTVAVKNGGANFTGSMENEAEVSSVEEKEEKRTAQPGTFEDVAEATGIREKNTSQLVKRMGRAETALGALLSYKKIAPSSSSHITDGEQNLLDEIVRTALSLADPTLVQWLDSWAEEVIPVMESSADGGEKHPLVAILRRLYEQSDPMLPSTEMP